MQNTSILNFCLPKKGPFSLAYANETNIRKAKSLQVINLTVFFLALVLVAIRSFVEETFPPQNITTVYLGPVFLMAFLVFKCKGMFKTSVWLLTFSAYLAITFRLLDAGGLSTANVILYTIFPLSSYVFLNDKLYIFQTILIILTLIGINFYIPQGNVVEPPVIKLFITIFALLICVAIIWVNDVFREDSHRRIKRYEKQSVGIKIISALNHELMNPLNILKGGLKIARKSRTDEWFDQCEKSVKNLEEKILKLNELIKEYELKGEKPQMSSIDTIKDDLES